VDSLREPGSVRLAPWLRSRRASHPPAEFTDGQSGKRPAQVRESGKCHVPRRRQPQRQGERGAGTDQPHRNPAARPASDPCRGPAEAHGTTLKPLQRQRWLHRSAHQLAPAARPSLVVTGPGTHWKKRHCTTARTSSLRFGARKKAHMIRILAALEMTLLVVRRRRILEPRSRLLVTSGISGKPMCEHLTSGFACPGCERLAVLGLNA
jgi:hypothetical protein